ncbi:rho GTPase-activating protein 24-like [Brienomyrus brachyistius]|uniref:rho GTPase-activating protein 24-like n=1 Tax=Brienomyrus brachyistius TaxID=42636 RepID=UPI0020B260B9|nr:rho GTPase-activating protein 24-like [Brienomyrus brachyistius]
MGARGTENTSEGKQAVCRTSSHLSNSTYRKIKRVLSFKRRVFGQRLEETAVYERRYGEHAAPLVVEQCVAFIRERGLEEVGLFRQPGQATLVKELQVAFDAGEKPTFDSSTDVHTVASLLKLYLRELPEPVVPFSCYQEFLQCGKRVHLERRQALEDLKKLLRELPVANFSLLHYVCRFLFEVQSHSHINKMSIQNLATVFGPNILRPKADDPESIIEGAALVQQLMSELIQECDGLFVKDAEAGHGPSSLLPPEPPADSAQWVQRSCPARLEEGGPGRHQASPQLSLPFASPPRESPQPTRNTPTAQHALEMEHCLPALRTTSPGGLADFACSSYRLPHSQREILAEKAAPLLRTGPPYHSLLQEAHQASDAHESTLSVYDNIHLTSPDRARADGSVPRLNPPKDDIASADSSSWSSCEIVLEGGALSVSLGSGGRSSSRTDADQPGSLTSLVISDGSPSSCSGTFLPPAGSDHLPPPHSSNRSIQSLVTGLQQQMARQKEEYESQIRSLEQRNEALQGEVSILHANLEQQRHWYNVVQIKMRNAERACADADRRNALLQQEMEQFFDTFGELTKEARKTERIIQSF